MSAIVKFLGIRGFIALGMGIALGIVMWRADAISADRERLRNALATEKATHAVTRLSVGTLEQTIASLNAEAKQRAEAFETARKQVAQREKELAGMRRSSDATIARLRELSEQEGQCAVPDELRELAEGL